MRLLIFMEIKCPAHDQLEAKLMFNLCCYSALIGFSYLCTLKIDGSIRGEKNNNKPLVFTVWKQTKTNFDLAYKGIC